MLLVSMALGFFIWPASVKLETSMMETTQNLGIPVDKKVHIGMCNTFLHFVLL